MPFTVKVELPDWCEERDTIILAGIECAAIRIAATGKLYHKIGRCSMCGECCKATEGQHFFPVVDGYCVHCVSEGKGLDTRRCTLATKRPYVCCKDTPFDTMPDRCTIKWEEVTA